MSTSSEIKAINIEKKTLLDQLKVLNKKKHELKEIDKKQNRFVVVYYYMEAADDWSGYTRKTRSSKVMKRFDDLEKAEKYVKSHGYIYLINGSYYTTDRISNDYMKIEIH